MGERAARPLLYRQIYQDLERKILSGEMGYGKQLPVLPDLCAHYGVSEAPVRRALDEMARAGMIVKRRGRGQGTFVARRLTRLTLRVLLLAGFNIYKSTLEACHEAFDLLAGIQEAAQEAGCDVQQVSYNGFDNLPPAGPDTGYLIVAMTWTEYEQGERLAAFHNAPFVLVNPPAGGYPSVRVDMEHGAFLGTDHLARLGHRRIAYVGGVTSAWAAPRIAGYRRALAAHGLPFDSLLVRETQGIEPSQDGEALDKLMALAAPPTAVFASSDYRALHLLAHATRSGIAVPAELSICGYDDVREGTAVVPSLTTVCHPRQELGRAAVGLLTDILRGEGSDLDTVREVVVAPTLIARNSSAPPRTP